MTPASGGGTTAITSLRDNIEFICTKNYSNFPDVHDLTPDPSEPVAFTAWNGNVIDWNEQIAKDFIISRTAALVLARVFDLDAPESSDYSNPEAAQSTLKVLMNDTLINSLTPADVAEAIEDAITAVASGSPAAASFARRARLVVSSIGISSIRKRARRMFTLIYRVVQAIQEAAADPAARDEFPFNDRKEGVRRLFDGAATSRNRGNASNYSEYIRNFSNNDREFVLANIAIFGNIGLHVIKSSRTGVLNCENVVQKMRQRNNIELSRYGNGRNVYPLNKRAKDLFEIDYDERATTRTGGGSNRS